LVGLVALRPWRAMWLQAEVRPLATSLSRYILVARSLG
jgi:hypothetical protein